MNCAYCNRLLNGFGFMCSGSPANYCTVGGKPCCSSCQIDKSKELEKMSKEIVGSCPTCGAPIYGIRYFPSTQEPLCSGDLYWYHRQATYSCCCRYQRSTDADVQEI